LIYSYAEPSIFVHTSGLRIEILVILVCGLTYAASHLNTHEHDPPLVGLSKRLVR
jgi:hypothetical protein